MAKPMRGILYAIPVAIVLWLIIAVVVWALAIDWQQDCASGDYDAVANGDGVTITCYLAETAEATATPEPTATPSPTPAPGNLLANPNCQGAHNQIPPGWTSEPSEGMWWNVSLKSTNNPPVGSNNYSCRWAQTSTRDFSFDPAGHDGFLYQVVAANPLSTTLRFSGYWTSIELTLFEVRIDGGLSPTGPWEPVWTPFSATQDTSTAWQEIPLRETTIAVGYPYYRFGLFCRYDSGIAGCKATVLHFETR